MSVAVVDIGKTNARVAIVAEDGRLEAMSRCRNDVVPGPPYPHFDAGALEGWILEALREHARVFSIEAIVPVAHGACAALLREGALALPVLDYEFTGPESCADYEREARDFQETGSPRLGAGLNLGRQLHWLAREHAPEFEASDTLLPWPQYWAFRLSGVAAYEPTSLGCHTDLWSPWRNAPSRFATRSGIAGRLPARVQAWSALGSPSPPVRDATGLGVDCRVLAGIHDSNASFLPHRIPRSEPFAVVSTGTWFVAMAHGAIERSLCEDLDMLVNVDAFGDPLPTARFAGGREVVAIAASDAPADDVVLDEVIALVERGARVLPGFSDLGGPFATREGAIQGIDAPRARDRRALASLYAALVTDLCLDLLGACGDIVIEGRFAADHAFVASLAALRAEQTVLRSADETGTLAGAALLARWPARGETVETARVAAPSPDVRRLLEAHRAEWRRLAT